MYTLNKTFQAILLSLEYLCLYADCMTIENIQDINCLCVYLYWIQCDQYFKDKQEFEWHY